MVESSRLPRPPPHIERLFVRMVRLNVDPNWQAQLEASRVLQAFLEAGATSVHQEAWGLLCSRNFLYRCRFTVVVFKIDELDLGRREPPREGRKGV